MYEELVKRLIAYSEVHEYHAGILSAAADAIEELSKPRWIPVTERLPQQSGGYLIFDGEDVSEAYYEKEETCDNWTDNVEMYITYHATHWMPLPEPPKEET